jgi:hypothetical protein
MALYVKQQREVSGAAEPGAEATSTTEPPSQRHDPSPGAAGVEGSTKAFRKRFQLPTEAPSIADRICQRRHHDWIEAFLVRHQSSRSSGIGV